MSLKDLVFSLKLDTAHFVKNAGASAKAMQSLANTKMSSISKEIQRLNDGTGKNDAQIKKLSKEYAHWQSVAARAAGQVRSELKRVDGEAQSLNKTMSAASVAKWAAGIYGVFKATGALVGQVKAGFTDNAELEQTRVFFTSLLGNVERANGAIQALRKEADITPFETKDVIATGKMLITAAENDKAKMMAYVKLAERLSVLNPEQGLTGAATAIKEALGGDYVSLKERFNIGLGEINGLRKAKKEGAELVDAVLKARNIGDEAIAAMGKTATGRLSTIFSFFSESRRLVVEGIFGKMSEMMGTAGDWLATNGTWIQDVAKGFGMWLVEAGAKTVQWVASFKADFEAAWGFAKQIWATFESGSMGSNLFAVFKELGLLLVDLLKFGATSAANVFADVLGERLPGWVKDLAKGDQGLIFDEYKNMSPGQRFGEEQKLRERITELDAQGVGKDYNAEKNAMNRLQVLEDIKSGKIGPSAGPTLASIFDSHSGALAQHSQNVLGGGLPGPAAGGNQPGFVQGLQQRGEETRKQQEAASAAAEAAAPKKQPTVVKKQGGMGDKARARLEAFKRKTNSKNYGGGRGMKLQVTSLDGKIRMVSGTT